MKWRKDAVRAERHVGLALDRRRESHRVIWREGVRIDVVLEDDGRMLVLIIACFGRKVPESRAVTSRARICTWAVCYTMTTYKGVKKLQDLSSRE